MKTRNNKKALFTGVNSELYNYAYQHTSVEEQFIQNLCSKTEEIFSDAHMISGRTVAQLLAMLIRLSSAKRILELGTYTGYSALMMATAMGIDGELITCDTNSETLKVAREYIKKSKVSEQIIIKEQSALSLLDELIAAREEFDIIYIDADKANYPNYYQKSKLITRYGGLIVIDNASLYQSVLNPKSKIARKVHETNKIIQNDNDVVNVFLTVSDGLNVVQKISR